ncbi:MAG: maleylpyruvate isomerase N-terminal domain-containing protein [Candidatus Kerfeldbacteria bacterium]|nr:maleylpyruvate isomerase N-terminal domain-containing protein [Candidatus Kerfeldbacteria bacterium]
MNAQTILFYGNKTVEDSIATLTAQEWLTVGATSGWTPKDVLAHLLSYELLLEEALGHEVDRRTLPRIEKMGKDHDTFSDSEVAARKDRAVEVVLKEYHDATKRVAALATKISPERYRAVGTIPWYGGEYSLDDYIVYAIYAHKREHMGMLRLFLKRLRSSS